MIREKWQPLLADYEGLALGFGDVCLAGGAIVVIGLLGFRVFRSRVGLWIGLAVAGVASVPALGALWELLWKLTRPDWLQWFLNSRYAPRDLVLLMAPLLVFIWLAPVGQFAILRRRAKSSENSKSK